MSFLLNQSPPSQASVILLMIRQRFPRWLLPEIFAASRMKSIVPFSMLNTNTLAARTLRVFQPGCRIDRLIWLRFA